MPQPYPTNQILRHSQDISQHVDLELIKRLVDSGLEQRLQLVQAILDLKSRLRIFDVAVRVGVRDGR